MPLRLGIALSGGGHRATAWGLGVLGAVVDTGLAAGTVSIASVSGGSIANAAVAARGDFTRLRGVEEYAEWVAPTLRVVARTGLFLPGTRTRRYVNLTLATLALWACALIALVCALGAVARGQPLWPFAVVGAVLGVPAALCGLRIGRLGGRARLVTPLIGAGLGSAVGAAAAAAVRHLQLGVGMAAVAVLVAIAVLIGLLALRALSRRGEAVRRALAHQLAPDGRDPLLRSIRSKVNHVFCTTDLEEGHCLFFAPAFVYGNARGLADTRTSQLTIAQVVQASAAVPPGFSPVFLPVPPFDGAGEARVDTIVPVSDGGVYDALGDEWETSFAERVHHHRQVAGLQEPADVLLVSDASPPFTHEPYRLPGLLTADLLGLLRNVDVMWSATTARRLHDLREQFRPDQRRDGALVRIQESPVDICRTAKAYGGPVARRAEAAEKFLDWRSSDEWAELSARSAAVPTTLGPLTVRVTLELLELGYTATLVALYVGLGLGSLKRFPREVFEEALRP